MKSTYIIGEIGQNHNGSVDIAKLIIDLAGRKPADDLFATDLKSMDAIKLTKRDLKEELADSAMSRPYVSPNSFGKTYGDHRSYLELDEEEHFEIYSYAKAKGLEMVETLCAVGCLRMLRLFQPDRLKVASRDLTNIPLLEAMAETKIPIILSTGMAGKTELDEALNAVSRHHDQITILHCLSQYPAEHKRLNLATISYLKKHYDKYTIGYSDHSIGIMIPVAAVAMGAEVIEKHITIDRNMKGTDQKGSLGPDGVMRMVRDIRVLEQAVGKEGIFIDPAITENRRKLERSLASKRLIREGETISEKDLHLLSPGDGVKWTDMDLLIGRRANRDISANEIIYLDMVL